MSVDHIQRFIFENRAVRGQVVRLSASYRQIMEQHRYPEAIAHLLGEALLSVCLLHSLIKNPGKLTLQFQGSGDLSLLSARCTHDFAIRGYANWKGKPPTHNNLQQALGAGQLVVTFEPEGPGQRYQSIIAVETDSIAKALEAYFAQSEQLPTQLRLAMDNEQGVGLMLQALPDKTDQGEMDWEHATILLNTVKPAELLNTDTPTLLHRLYHEDTVRLLDPTSVRFGCGCSVEKMANALALSGQAEIEALLAENAYVEVTCDFCGNQYRFDEFEVQDIFNQAKTDKPHLH